VSVGTIIDLQDKLVSADMHPAIDKTYVPTVVSENVYLIIGQILLSLVENLVSSMMAFYIPPDPANVLGNVNSFTKVVSLIILMFPSHGLSIITLMVLSEISKGLLSYSYLTLNVKMTVYEVVNWSVST
jgi:hypothetical protein